VSVGKEKVKTMNNIRKCLSILAFVVALMGATTASFAQPSMETSRKNLVEVYLPVSHFFDQTPTNWLFRYRARFYPLMLSDGRIVHFDETIYPATYGIQYGRALSSGGRIRLAVLRYYRHYGGYMTKDYPKVVYITRGYWLFSPGYSHPLIRGRHLLMSLLGEINYRIGKEEMLLRAPVLFEGMGTIRGDRVALNDVGASVGARLERVLPFDFLLFGEIKYTRFFYLRSHMLQIDAYKAPSTHTLTLTFGVGYRF